MTKCQECFIHKVLHDVVMAEKRTTEFKLNEAQRERDEARAALADAYRRGAEAMREAASNAIPGHYSGDIIRALPIPEDKS